MDYFGINKLINKITLFKSSIRSYKNAKRNYKIWKSIWLYTDQSFKA